MKHLKCLMVLAVLSLLVVPAAMADTAETTDSDVAIEAVTAEAVEAETTELPADQALELDLEIQEPVLMSAPADCVYRCPGLPLCPNYPDHSVQCINGCCIYSPL